MAWLEKEAKVIEELVGLLHNRIDVLLEDVGTFFLMGAIVGGGLMVLASSVVTLLSPGVTVPLLGIAVWAHVRNRKEAAEHKRISQRIQELQDELPSK